MYHIFLLLGSCEGCKAKPGAGAGFPSLHGKEVPGCRMGKGFSAAVLLLQHCGDGADHNSFHWAGALS